MDDDFTFAASVWSTSEPVNLLPTPKQTLHDISPSSDFAPRQDSHFDDFDDFGTPSQTAEADVEDDDFGDFGDFGEGEEIAIPSEFGEEVGFGEEVRIPGPSSHAYWEPLRLDPMPSRAVLEDHVNDILAPIWGEDISDVTIGEGIREVEGISQILVTPERYLCFRLPSSQLTEWCSRDLYNMLFKSPPPTKPPNWTRSRIRRQHLIALGIPVNLDEVLPQVNGKPLPPLQITTRPVSAPPGPRNSSVSGNAAASTSNSRAGTPQPGSRSGQSQFGPKPELDETKIKKLLDLNPGAFHMAKFPGSERICALVSETLPIQPLSTLERHLADLRAQTANTSALLTYLLQTRESLQQDSETYNGLIAELVGEAQKIKTGKARTTVRRGSGMT